MHCNSYCARDYLLRLNGTSAYLVLWQFNETGEIKAGDWPFIKNWLKGEQAKVATDCALLMAAEFLAMYKAIFAGFEKGLITIPEPTGDVGIDSAKYFLKLVVEIPYRRLLTSYLAGNGEVKSPSATYRQIRDARKLLHQLDEQSCELTMRRPGLNIDHVKYDADLIIEDLDLVRKRSQKNHLSTANAEGLAKRPESLKLLKFLIGINDLDVSPLAWEWLHAFNESRYPQPLQTALWKHSEKNRLSP